MSTVHADAERQERVLVFTKGAPDVLLARCSQELVGETATAARRRRAARRSWQANDELAGQALRTLGDRLPFAARRRRSSRDEVDESVEQDLVFAGLVGMIDPPRDEAKEAVARAQARRHPPA